MNNYPIHSVIENYHSTYAVFEIPLREGNTAYLKQTISEKHVGYIVLLDKERFLNTWSHSYDNIVPELSRGDEKTWRADRKFSDAEDGFSYGLENPVPLATLACYEILTQSRFLKRKKIQPQMGFINGITRTIWLLANGAEAFPAFCYDKKEAFLLTKYAGYSGVEPIGIDHLFSELMQNTKLFSG